MADKSKKSRAVKRGRSNIPFKHNKNANVDGKGNGGDNVKKRQNFVVASVNATTGTPNQKKWALVAYLFTLASFLAPIIYLIVKIVCGSFDTIGEGYNSKADYALMIAECVLGLIVIHIPSILAHNFKFEIPFFLYICYIIFLYCSIFLGEAQSFYYKVPHWDTILHAMSSLMLGFFGFLFVTILNRDEHTLMSLSPFFVSLFAFCFAVTIGAVWEIYEFSADGIAGFNMQKYAAADGTQLVGHAALVDTMKDIIIDCIGAMIATIIGYISLKKNKKWLIPKLTDKKTKSLKTVAITDSSEYENHSFTVKQNAVSPDDKAEEIKSVDDEND